jgi:hypothetical protein
LELLLRRRGDQSSQARMSSKDLRFKICRSLHSMSPQYYPAVPQFAKELSRSDAYLVGTSHIVLPFLFQYDHSSSSAYDTVS